MASTPENKSSWMILIIAAIAILAVAAVSLTKQAPPVTVYGGDQAADRNILSVTGTHELVVAPDEAEISFSVVTRNDNAAMASSENAILMNAVVDAIKAEGIAAGDIETTNVYLSKVTEYDYELRKSVDKGYEQRATVRVTVKNLDNVGSVLDAAVQAGVNDIDDVAFTLTPESQTRYKEQALTEATKTAKRKAQTLADASGATLGRITSLSENSFGYQPYYANSKAVMAMDGAESAPTPISPEQVSMSVSVSIAYELE
jgi:uncharacterized protein YggE